MNPMDTNDATDSVTKTTTTTSVNESNDINNNEIDDIDIDDDVVDDENKSSKKLLFNDCNDEEFLIHLQFDEDSHPLLRYNVDDCKIIGIHNEKLLIRFGDSFFYGNIDQRQQSSILFTYEPIHKFIQEINKCNTKILMKRIILRPKDENQMMMDQ